MNVKRGKAGLTFFLYFYNVMVLGSQWEKPKSKSRLKVILIRQEQAGKREEDTTRVIAIGDSGEKTKDGVKKLKAQAKSKRS